MRKNLIKILAILLCFTMMVVVNVSAATTITTNQGGYHDGYYYVFWSDGVGSVNMTLGSGGNYSSTWSNCGNFLCGKGWYPGAARTVSYTGSFNVSGNGFLSVYGWTTNPLVEYYVVENYGSWTPPGGSPVGTIITDGGLYNLYRTQRVNQLSVIGIATYYTYWSVRTSRRSSGTVTMRNHFDAWANKGWNLGAYHYQIVATEGYQSSGSSNITVLTGPIGPTATPTPSATPLPIEPGNTPTPTPTQRPNTPTPTRPRTTPGGNYVVTYAIQSDWGNGATINITIKNNTTTPVYGWSLAFTFPGNQTITNLWNGTYTQSGADLSVKNAGGNANIPANSGSTNLGFNLSYSGINAKPTSFTLNGSACTVQ